MGVRLDLAEIMISKNTLWYSYVFFAKLVGGGGKPPPARGSDFFAREHLVLTKGQPSVSSVFETSALDLLTKVQTGCGQSTAFMDKLPPCIGKHVINKI